MSTPEKIVHLKKEWLRIVLGINILALICSIGMLCGGIISDAAQHAALSDASAATSSAGPGMALLAGTCLIITSSILLMAVTAANISILARLVRAAKGIGETRAVLDLEPR